VAESSCGALYYLLTDHLGSTALTANESGARIAELRYRSWGESRSPKSQRRFTGQTLDDSAGCHSATARSPSLTCIPEISRT